MVMNQWLFHQLFNNFMGPGGISGKRRDGVTMVPWSNGECLLWDVTVVNTLANSYLNLSYQNSGSVAD